MAKQLTRNTNDKLLGGVCSGVAQYLGVDTGLTRLITLAIVLLTGIGPFLYLGAWFLLPDETSRSGITWVTDEIRSRKNSTTDAPAQHNPDDLR